MPRAICLVKDREPYPHQHVITGLRAAGYDVTSTIPGKPKSDDLLIIWNRMGDRHFVARTFEGVGAPVIVNENGWIGREKGRKFYSLCRNHHNGAGAWKVGDDSRWDRFGIELKPWRKEGRHVLILSSRGIGEPGVAQPRQWINEAYAQLQKATRRPIKVRNHPGDSNADISPDLVDCHAVVTWASGAAIKAIAAGIPAFYGLKRWIGAPAACHDLGAIEKPFLGDRLPMFRRLAWAQWTADEIATGEPIRRLIETAPNE
jgi:hypothetical protein